MAGERWRDPGTTAWELLAEVHVRCPSCAAAAVVRPAPGVDEPPALDDRRLTCGSCGHVAVWPRPGVDRVLTWWDDGRDPWFGEPLLARTPCAGHVLWAFGPAHVDLVEGHVRADVRERAVAGPGRAASVVERLPAWVTAAGHRDDVLAACDRLRDLLRASRGA